MELLAVIRALEAIKWKKADILIYTDSKYVADAVTKGWVFDWERKGFKKKKNPDLWRRFLKIYPRHNITFRWVEGHSGIEGNEICDRLAVEAAALPGRPADKGYEESTNDPSLF